MRKNFRGLENVEFIWHGTQSDPELRYKDCIFNYWDIENALYDMYKEDVESVDDDAFNLWLKENENRCYGYLDDLVSFANT